MRSLLSVLFGALHTTIRIHRKKSYITQKNNCTAEKVFVIALIRPDYSFRQARNEVSMTHGY